MKTEIVKQINIRLDKNDKELIEKVIPLINELINTGDNYDCHYYTTSDDMCRNTREVEDVVEFLKELVYSDVIELT